MTSTDLADVILLPHLLKSMYSVKLNLFEANVTIVITQFGAKLQGDVFKEFYQKKRQPGVLH